MYTYVIVPKHLLMISPGVLFDIETIFATIGSPKYKYNTVMRMSYLYNEYSHTVQTASWYWKGAQNAVSKLHLFMMTDALAISQNQDIINWDIDKVRFIYSFLIFERKSEIKDIYVSSKQFLVYRAGITTIV